jgi:hypothetical protein
VADVLGVEGVGDPPLVVGHQLADPADAAVLLGQPSHSPAPAGCRVAVECPDGGPDQFQWRHAEEVGQLVARREDHLPVRVDDGHTGPLGQVADQAGQGQGVLS